MSTRLATFRHRDRKKWIVIAAVGLTVAACDSAVSPEGRLLIGASSRALGNDFSSWSGAVNAEFVPGQFNTSSLDGCPFISPDGKTFYLASNRPGSVGLDIWVSTRSGPNEPWGDPQNVSSINSGADDFCPTISRDGKLLYFVSTRSGGCGMGDIYVARLRPDGFDVPEMLPCDNSPPYDAVNSPANEFSPFPQLDPAVGPVLYFSSFRAGGVFAEPAGNISGDSDLYWSTSHGGAFGTASLIPLVNTAQDDGQPNVGSDGLELFFYSTRPGGLGAADLYVSTRARAIDAWSAPANLGAAVNSDAGETRPSLSWDGLTLYFGSTRTIGGEGNSDIWVTTRQRLVPGGN